MDPRRGHSVLQVPVPELEPFVRGRTRHYDTAYLSADPAFTHAHVTVLGPFVEAMDEAVAEEVAAIVATSGPFDFRLERVDTFPDGIVHLVPEPSLAFRALTRRFVEAFPGFPPYGGAVDDPTPHLTLDLLGDDVTVASTRALLGDTVPVACRADRLDLAWYEPGRCHVVRSWELGLPAVGPGG